jgi:glucose-1-phosphate thymidylyltransferase
VEIVVLAAGEGRRLRPFTERWPKPLLPVDGRAVIGTLLRELAAAGLERVTMVTGHLAERLERLVGDGSAYGVSVRYVRQPRPMGSADALVRAAVEPPYLVTAADTVYGEGDVARFLAEVGGSGLAGALAVRRQPGRPDHTRVRVDDGRVVTVADPTLSDELTAAPLSYLGPPVAARLAEVTRPPFGPPYELKDAFQLAIDAGARVPAIEIGRTRDLTNPLDLAIQNFPYLAE